MSIAEPLPESPWGLANWQDYVNNWRELDAEWLMARSILRFQSTAERDNKLTSATTGQVIYNNNPGGGELPRLELRAGSSWVPYKPLPIYMTKGEDSASQVLLSHVGAGGKGVAFTPTAVNVTANFSVLGGVFGADASGITFKTGAKTVKFTTDATSLVSDSPLTVTNLNAAAITATSLTTPTIGGVTSLTAANINMTGTFTGGTINGTGGTISSVKFGTQSTGSTRGGGRLLLPAWCLLRRRCCCGHASEDSRRSVEQRLHLCRQRQRLDPWGVPPYHRQSRHPLAQGWRRCPRRLDLPEHLLSR